MSEMLAMMEQAEVEARESADPDVISEGLSRALCGLSAKKKNQSKRPVQDRLIILRSDGRMEIYPASS